mmetsp:Transcript_11694/g.24483  ORF Transcript_11694/g.24483 Transcript_11694/m.24483 type:complete len:501 (-) Transcript_11694:283-1785(-)
MMLKSNAFDILIRLALLLLLHVSSVVTTTVVNRRINMKLAEHGGGDESPIASSDPDNSALRLKDRMLTMGKRLLAETAATSTPLRPKKLTRKEKRALVEEHRRAAQFRPSAVLPKTKKPVDGKCPSGYIIMGEDSKTGTPRIDDRIPGAYRCKRADKAIYNIAGKYQRKSSMDPEGTQAAKDATNSESPSRNFQSVREMKRAMRKNARIRKKVTQVKAISRATMATRWLARHSPPPPSSPPPSPPPPSPPPSPPAPPPPSPPPPSPPPPAPSSSPPPPPPPPPPSMCVVASDNFDSGITNFSALTPCAGYGCPSASGGNLHLPADWNNLFPLPTLKTYDKHTEHYKLSFRVVDRGALGFIQIEEMGQLTLRVPLAAEGNPQFVAAKLIQPDNSTVFDLVESPGLFTAVSSGAMIDLTWSMSTGDVAVYVNGVLEFAHTFGRMLYHDPYWNSGRTGGATIISFKHNCDRYCPSGRSDSDPPNRRINAIIDDLTLFSSSCGT